MDSRPIRVVYEQDVAGFDGQPARLKGETYGVASVEAAKQYHPFATVVGAEDEVIAEGETAPVEPVEATEEEWKGWFKKLREKAEKDGQPDPIPVYVGETEREYTERAEAAAKAAADAAQADADAIAPGGVIADDVVTDADGNVIARTRALGDTGAGDQSGQDAN